MGEAPISISPPITEAISDPLSGLGGPISGGPLGSAPSPRSGEGLGVFPSPLPFLLGPISPALGGSFRPGRRGIYLPAPPSDGSPKNPLRFDERAHLSHRGRIDWNPIPPPEENWEDRGG